MKPVQQHRIPALVGVPARHPLRLFGAHVERSDLEGADLHGLDLRGLDLTGANLREANLRNARCGMSRGWEVFVTLGALLASVGIGVVCGLGGSHLESMLRSDSTHPVARFSAAFLAAELLILLAGFIWKGPRAALRWLLPQAFALIAAGMVVAWMSGYTGKSGLVMVGGTLLMVALLSLGALARAVAGASGRLLFMVVALSGALAGRAIGGGLVAFAMALGAVIVGQRVLSRPESAPSLSRWASAIVSAGGTSFRGADLRGAHLEQATLDCCDLRGANFDGAHLDAASLRVVALDPLRRDG
jgi:hypothetical protein